MVITICGSLSFTKEIKRVGDELTALGHEVLMPNGVTMWLIFKDDFDSKLDKISTDAIRKHLAKIGECDAILVCNYTKNDIKNYIGANTFIEMAFAHHLKKPIFCLNELPDMPYIDDELAAMQATVIDGDLEKIKI